MLLLIDNYDSFTHNVARYFAELGAPVEVVRNDQINVQQMAQLPLTGLVISPGPCTPNEAGISLAAIDYFKDKLPILGVCLGHQAIGQAFGGKIVRAERVMHGKTSAVEHQQGGVLKGLPSPFTVARYHSLLVDYASLPDCLVVDGVCYNSRNEPEIMAMHHRQLPIFGVQYHPEAIQSEFGHAVLKNFLEYCQREYCQPD
ncbi:anthranilate synthase component II [Pseudidiomarina mangrovi]|uniref:anthranilate synthase component II n=1 Tax=Pseudidiomarina mangrovi TaxID=2487133 RepID=UPI000FCC06C6|nr:aminodeoxychorismate/anthranilate synthase component II [Pseudidiomarina mangrovi]